MANDYGYFGSGKCGYAHYKQSFDRNFGGSGGGEGQQWRRYDSAAGLCCLSLLLLQSLRLCCGQCNFTKRRMLPIKEGYRLRRGGPLLLAFCSVSW